VKQIGKFGKIPEDVYETLWTQTFVTHTRTNKQRQWQEFSLGVIAQMVWGQKSPNGVKGHRSRRSWSSLQTLCKDFDRKNDQNLKISQISPPDSW